MRPPTNQNAPSATHLALAKVKQSDMKSTLVSMRLMNSSLGTSPDVPPSISSILYTSNAACAHGCRQPMHVSPAGTAGDGEEEKESKAFKRAKMADKDGERRGREGRWNGVRGRAVPGKCGNFMTEIPACVCVHACVRVLLIVLVLGVEQLCLQQWRSFSALVGGVVLRHNRVLASTTSFSPPPAIKSMRY